jgi:hypothetical protein
MFIALKDRDLTELQIMKDIIAAVQSSKDPVEINRYYNTKQAFLEKLDAEDRC